MRSEASVQDMAAKPSPSKRKRSISDPTIRPFAPLLRDDIGDGTIYTEAQLAGARSPRSIVADRLSELDIQGTIPVLQFRGGAECPNGNGGAVRRQKKVKFSRAKDGASPRLSGLRSVEEVEGESNGGSDDGVVKAGLQSKPQPRQRRLRSPPPRATGKKEIEETPQAPNTLTMPSPSSSPSPPSSPSGFFEEHTPTGQSHAPSTRDPLVNPPFKGNALLKQTSDHVPSEDLDPDDDGTGINGIGFRPTPAMAWQRMQKRKQQVQEWRAREAKEARQKRNERRNKAAAAAAMGVGVQGVNSPRRTVHFAS